MSTSTPSLLRQAQAALKSGQQQQARQMLQQAVRQNPHNYQAWLWLATVATSPRASLDYVLRAEALMPNDPAVQKARAWAEKRLHAPDHPTTQPALRPPKGPPNHSTNRPPDRPTNRPPDQQTWSTAVTWGGLTLVLVIILLLGGYLIGNGFSPTVVAGQIRAAASLPGNNQPDTSQAPAEGQAIASGQTLATGEELTTGQFLTATPAPAQVSARLPAGELSLAAPLQAKDLATAGSQAGEPRPTWTVTPLPTATLIPTPTFIPTFASIQEYEAASRPFGVGPGERWINVNLTSQRLTAYEGDAAVFSTLVSSGTWNHPTVTGQFRIWLRYESQTMDGRLLGYDYYLENVPYVMYFYQDYALHGTYWHNNFGTPMSHGCVNLSTADAGWLFNWATIGTLVNVHH